MKGAIAIAAGLSIIIMGAYAMEKTTTPLQATDYIVLGMGCFWGAEKRMAKFPGSSTWKAAMQAAIFPASVTRTF